ncbi:hypothetical protein AA313_de0206701 [Arthrobotrys entomopaga]|nr:hypothetical protein AA313_de0206701 [Arthrobotrys entomopaga]
METSKPSVLAIPSPRCITNLPVEIQSQILSNLPLRSQVRAAKACKLWEDIIIRGNLIKQKRLYNESGHCILLTTENGLTCEVKGLKGANTRFYLGTHAKIHRLSSPNCRHMKAALEITSYEQLLDTLIEQDQKEGDEPIANILISGHLRLCTQVQVVNYTIPNPASTVRLVVHRIIRFLEIQMAALFERYPAEYNLEFRFKRNPVSRYDPEAPKSLLYCTAYLPDDGAHFNLL